MQEIGERIAAWREGATAARIIVDLYQGSMLFSLASCRAVARTLGRFFFGASTMPPMGACNGLLAAGALFFPVGALRLPVSTMISKSGCFCHNDC